MVLVQDCRYGFNKKHEEEYEMNHRKTFLTMGCLLLMFCLWVVEGIAHEWMAPKDAAGIKNPIVLNDTSVAEGQKIYSQNCAECHGDNLEGLSAEASGLEMAPPNLKKRIKSHSDGDFFWKIQHGRGDMPSFSDDLSEEQIWELINYIRSEAE
jgi:mono/diheme cytochrome c family protein